MSTTLHYKPPNRLQFSSDFLKLFCEKNSDGSKKLRLKGNEMQQRFGERLIPKHMIHVSKFLENNPDVNDLDLSYNSIGDEGFGHLCNSLKKENSLEHLNVTHCDITYEGIKSFYYAAEKRNLILKTLRLTGNKIGPQGGPLTGMIVGAIPTMEYLDMGDTDQTIYSIDSMFFQLYRSSLKVINVSRPLPQTMTSQIDHTFIGGSLSEIIAFSALVEMHAQKCDLDGHDMERMIAGLKVNRSLQFLDIGYNNICCVGAIFLAEWLQTKPALLGLNIAANCIRNSGARALSVAVPQSKLRYLDISKNKIGDAGIVRILVTIKKPYMMRYLFIWGNNFGSSVCKIIERMIKSKVFDQDKIDVKVYCVDGVYCGAHNPVDHYKHRYYGVTDFGCAAELKIKRNIVETPDSEPRALVNFKHIDRCPPIEDGVAKY